MMYDKSNAFAKILRGEIPCNKKIAENDYFLAFHDLYPKAAIHALVIPKEEYTDFHDFIQNASTHEIGEFYKGVESVIQTLDLEHQGYRLVQNTGQNGGQEVMHYHVHILGGELLPSF